MRTVPKSNRKTKMPHCGKVLKSNRKIKMPHCGKVLKSKRKIVAWAISIPVTHMYFPGFVQKL